MTFLTAVSVASFSRSMSVRVGFQSAASLLFFVVIWYLYHMTYQEKKRKKKKTTQVFVTGYMEVHVIGWSLCAGS